MTSMEQCWEQTTTGATAPNHAQIQATGLAPSDNRESAIMMTLPPGTYTAIVRGVNGTTGVALVEAYALP